MVNQRWELNQEDVDKLVYTLNLPLGIQPGGNGTLTIEQKNEDNRTYWVLLHNGKRVTDFFDLIEAVDYANNLVEKLRT